MKMTLEIPDDLFREAKAKAALEGMKLKDLVAEGLRLRLALRERVRPAADKPRPMVENLDALPLIKGRPGTPSLTVGSERVHKLEMEAEMERHEASLR